MTETYLLECECGKRNPVGPSQAGREVRCACGATLDVPALRAMRRLPVAETSAAEEHSTWSGRQRLWVVGGLLLALAAALGGFVRWNHPPPPEAAIKADLQAKAEAFRREVPGYSVAELRKNFELLSSVNLQMWPRTLEDHDYHRIYRNTLATNRNWSIVAWSLAGLGMLVIASTHVFSAFQPGAPRGKLRKGQSRSRQH